MQTILYLINNWETIANYILHKYRHNTFILSAIKGLRNGLVYGARIRAPHALVMVFLFGDGTVLQKLLTIFQLTKTHAFNLARFVFSYKLLHGFLTKLEGQQKEWHAFAAASVMGYLVFGSNNSVNMQINLYLLSRVVVGLAKLAVDQQLLPQPNFPVFPLFAAGVWGLVLWLFEHHTEVLQGSLAKSMTYLYKDSNIWTNIQDFLIRNK
ncbi:unnamed protein product [Auanema sp. JU1783]|nr:unnamed protein product [Auanema sp. JU1783]